jgi:hypothetical protein
MSYQLVLVKYRWSESLDLIDAEKPFWHSAGEARDYKAKPIILSIIILAVVTAYKDACRLTLN